MKQALQKEIFPEGIICTKNKEIRTVTLSPTFELIKVLNSAKMTSGDPLSSATEPELRLIVKEVRDWYSSFGLNKQFFISYSV